jgi:hypothetical protein
MDEAAQKDPKNRDVAFFRARVKAFGGNHAEALRIVNEWPAIDNESREIRGDLAWYSGNPTEAETWYRQGINKTAPASSWKLWLKALRAKKDPRFKPALKEGIRRFPKDGEIRAMGMDPVENVPATKVPPETTPALPNEEGVRLESVEAPLNVQTDANGEGETEAAVGEQDDLEAAPAVSPKEKKAKSSGLIDRDRPKYRAALAGTVIQESQDQSVLAEDFDVAVIAYKKSLSLGLSHITRDYGPLSLTDTPIRAALGIGYVMDKPSLTQSHETTLSFGGTPDAHFTPDRFAALRHEIFFSDYFSIFGEIGAKWYPELYVRTIMLGTAYTSGFWRYHLKLFNTQAKNNDAAGFISVAYQGWRLTPEVYLVGGRDAASRPYLFGNENEVFFAAGVQVGYRFNLRWSGRAVFEKRWEDGFNQRTLSLVLLWFDR